MVKEITDDTDKDEDGKDSDSPNPGYCEALLPA